MKNENQLGINIRSLRKAYGETQEQLGEVLHVEKNTISSYETGMREPGKETVREIAKHYTISIEELLHSDLSSIGKIQIDKDAFLNSIDIIVPIVSSEKALKNTEFRTAYHTHKKFYNELKRGNMDNIDDVDICLDGYSEALKDDEIAAESAGNIIGLKLLLVMMITTSATVLKDQPAGLLQVARKDEKTRKILEDTDSSLEKDAEEILADFFAEESADLVAKLQIVKDSKEWSDLGDYYLALQYVWNLVDNNLDRGFNQRIGIEMLNAFVSVNNIYAARFVKFNIEAVTGKSSRFVDDKQ